MHTTPQTPSWTPCTEWTYSGGLLAEIHLDGDEWPDSLHVSGPGVDYAARIGLSEPAYADRNQLNNLQLGCGYHYHGWGGTHPSDCECMQGQTGNVHGVIGFSWEFEAEPAERLHVTVSPDTLGWQWWGAVQVEAQYADGEPAPLADLTELTLSADATPYGSLLSLWCYYGCSVTGRATRA